MNRSQKEKNNKQYRVWFLFVSSAFFLVQLIIINWSFLFSRREKTSIFQYVFKYKSISVLVFLLIFWRIFLISHSSTMTDLHVKARKSPYSGTKEIQVNFLMKIVVQCQKRPACHLESISSRWKSSLECRMARLSSNGIYSTRSCKTTRLGRYSWSVWMWNWFVKYFIEIISFY